MDNLYFLIPITLLFLYTTFLIAKGPLTDNRYKKWWKRINQRGWLVIITHFVILTIYILQSIISSNKIFRNEMQLKYEHDQRSEIIQNEVTKKTDQLFRSISSAFASQGIKIDSMQKLLSERENISYITNNKILESEPFFGIKQSSLKFDKNGVYYGFLVRDSGITDIKAKFTVLMKTINGKSEIFTQPFLTKDISIPANFNTDNKKLVNFINPDPKIDYMYIHFSGKYSNLERTREYNFDELYMLYKDENKFGIQVDYKKDSILNIMYSESKE